MKDRLISNRIAKVSYPTGFVHKTHLIRDHWYLEDTNIAKKDCYADDFGYQWNELAGNYTTYGNIHLSQLARIGIKVSEIQNSRVLDAGSGSGRLSDLLKAFGADVMSLDYSEALLKYALRESSPRSTLLRASIESIPVKSQTFDVVICWGVLHHVQDPAKALKELIRTTRIGGSIYIWVYADTAWMRRRQFICEYLGRLSTSEMDSYSSFLAEQSVFLSSNERSHLAKRLSKALCFTVKSDPIQTKGVLFDGLGPTWHHLLYKEWFLKQLLKIQRTSPFRVSSKFITGNGLVASLTRHADFSD